MMITKKKRKFVFESAKFSSIIRFNVMNNFSQKLVGFRFSLLSMNYERSPHGSTFIIGLIRKGP